MENNEKDEIIFKCELTKAGTLTQRMHGASTLEMIVAIAHILNPIINQCLEDHDCSEGTTKYEILKHILLTIEQIVMDKE